MHFPQEAVLKCLILLQIGIGFATASKFKGVASPTNFILMEEYTSSLNYDGKIKINSNIPVTVQQYNDNDYFFLEGEQPLFSNEAIVLVTSDCGGTTYIPQIRMGSNTIDVNVQGVPAPGDMPFLESSSYEADWSYADYWCEAHRDHGAPPAAARIRRRISSVFESFLPPSFKTSFLRDVTLMASASGEVIDHSPQDTPPMTSSTNVCNVNVEVMLDGCDHNVVVNAPKARVIPATLDNVEYESSSENECVTNYEADIMFTSEPSLEGEDKVIIPSLGSDGVCMRAVPGRPFVDSSGKKLQASPLIALNRANEVTIAQSASYYPSTNNNTTATTISQNQLLLGQEWTKNALGEHVSVASFSAFSIALMTNGAPSDLVHDALNAGLDEVRHAKTSFDIASRLTGQKVEAGPLPESTHVFKQDMKALALAVAREGCIDETLSALEAAAEVDLINSVLANDNDNGTIHKYSGIDTEILTWIRDELRTISLEESQHSALAWRTFDWACSVDADACDFVKDQVLNEENLERAFQHRFGESTFDDVKVMKESWRKIYSQQQNDDLGDTIVDEDVANGKSLVCDMAVKVIHGTS